MNRIHHLFAILMVIVLGTILGGCTAAMDESVRENVRVPGLQEGVQAKDKSLETAVESNIMSDLELRWFVQTYGITVEVSHTVATVYMKVKTDELHDRAIALAAGTEGVSDVIDNIDVDATLDSAPFEW